MVADLRKMGFSVLDLSGVGNDCPDLLIGRQGMDMLVEVKTRRTKHKQVEASKYLTPGQGDFHKLWRGAKPFACFTAIEAANEFNRRARRQAEWRAATAQARTLAELRTGSRLVDAA